MKFSKFNPFNVTKTEEENRIKYKSHPHLFYVLEPNQNINGVYINKFGFRSPDIEDSSDKIILFGNSTLFGSGLYDNQTINYYLGKLLPNYQVINTGMSGYVIEQEFYLFYYEVLRKIRNIKYIIFLDGYTEVLHTFLNKEINLPPYYKEKKKYQKYGELCIKNYFLYIKNKIKDKFLNEEEYNLPHETLLVNNYLHYINLIKDIARSRDIKAYFLIQPSLTYSIKKYDIELQDEIKNKYYRIINKFVGLENYIYQVYREFEKVNISNFIFMGDLFRNNIEKYYLDHAHYTEEANNLIAEKILSIIKERTCSI